VKFGAPPNVTVSATTVADNVLARVRTVEAAGTYVDRPGGKTLLVRVYDPSDAVVGSQYGTFLTTSTWSVRPFRIPMVMGVSDYSVEATLHDFVSGVGEVPVDAASMHAKL
jgi:hypothetical protein